MANITFDLSLTGTVGSYDFDSRYVDYVLRQKVGKPVNVLIDSMGGAVPTALSISGAFAAHGDVTVHYRGMNASAATVSSMGAKKVVMDENAMYLVHRCSALIFEWDWMNEPELEGHIKKLEGERQNLAKIDLAIAKAYARRTGKSMQEVQELMDKDLWLTAEEARDFGFVDEIKKAEKKAKLVITNSMAESMNQAGIPIPTCAQREESLLQRLRSFFINHTMEEKETEGKKTPQEQKPKEPQDTHVKELSKERDELKKQVEELTKERDELKNQVEAKAKPAEDKKPAEEPQEVVDCRKPRMEAEEPSMGGFADTFNKANEIYKMV